MTTRVCGAGLTRRGRRATVAAAAIAVAAVAATAPASVRGDAAPPHLTVIGDSVMTAVIWNDEPLQIVDKGLDVDMEVAVCRRLVGVSCPFEGSRASTLLDVVAAFGPRLGRVVVVVGGYNEPEEEFADAIEQSLAALRNAGVQRVVWANLSERRSDFARMNVTLANAARRHPELILVDWAGASRAHDDWFQNDGIHLTYAGAIGMARLLRDGIDRALAPPTEAGALDDGGFAITKPATTLPEARVGRWYDTSLLVRGGTAPYRWKVPSGPLPKGLHLAPSGRIFGIPTAPFRAYVVFRVQDEAGLMATRRTLLVVNGGTR